MTDKFWTIRFHPYSKKSHRKARWKKAEKRWFKRDPKRVADLEEVIRWAEEA